jgi:hypothetical protein
LAKQERKQYLHHLVELELEHLPPCKEEETLLDVGKDDCQLEF